MEPLKPNGGSVMNIHRRIVLGLLACASAASLGACSAGLITVSQAAAASSPATTTPRPAKHAAVGDVRSAVAVAGTAVAADASSSPSESEKFQMVTTSGTSKSISVIASGQFTAPGTDERKADADSDPFPYGTLAFPGGTFQLNVPKHSPGAVGSSGDPRTCLVTGSGVGTYTLSSGTGKYKRISGSGDYTLSFVEILAKVNGTCSQTRPPVAFQEVVTASGPASLR
jgi:hypothetical protein